MADRCVIWCVSDGKAGHVNQIHGLVRALSRYLEVSRHDVGVGGRWAGAGQWLLGRFAAGRDLPRPDLIISAGHATHLAALAARRAYGGRVVVMMKPSWPLRWFDLCIIPEHDAPPTRDNVLVTRGVLNVIEPATSPRADCGLLLIGGPSRHYGWSDARMVQQVREVVAAEPQRHWTLTTSRRTPAATVKQLMTLTDNLASNDGGEAEAEPGVRAGAGRDAERVAGQGAGQVAGQITGQLTIVPYEQTSPDWVPRQLAQASAVWVSEDSVSMVYEALTAGAAVGLLAVPLKSGHSGDASNRVSKGLASLIADGWVTPFNAWRERGTLAEPPEPLHEADRCANYIVRQWFAS